MMERRKFSREFKLEAVKLVRERGVKVAQASERASIEARMKHAIFEYARLQNIEPVNDWLRDNGGREPTFEVIREADWQWMLRNIKIQI